MSQHAGDFGIPLMEARGSQKSAVRHRREQYAQVVWARLTANRPACSGGRTTAYIIRRKSVAIRGPHQAPARRRVHPRRMRPGSRGARHLTVRPRCSPWEVGSERTLSNSNSSHAALTKDLSCGSSFPSAIKPKTVGGGPVPVRWRRSNSPSAARGKLTGQP